MDILANSFGFFLSFYFLVFLPQYFHDEKDKKSSFTPSSFLFSCKNENAPSSEKPVSSEEIISSLNTSLNETVSSESSPSEIKGCILNTTDFPKNVAGGYPADQEIVSGDGSTFFISSCMQAGGKGDGHIQMKKGVSFFYNKTKLAGSLSLRFLETKPLLVISQVFLPFIKEKMNTL